MQRAQSASVKTKGLLPKQFVTAKLQIPTSWNFRRALAGQSSWMTFIVNGKNSWCDRVLVKWYRFQNKEVVIVMMTCTLSSLIQTCVKHKLYVIGWKYLRYTFIHVEIYFYFIALERYFIQFFRIDFLFVFHFFFSLLVPTILALAVWFFSAHFVIARLLLARFYLAICRICKPKRIWVMCFSASILGSNYFAIEPSFCD